MIYTEGLTFAQAADENDQLGHFRKKFRIPQREGKDQIYLLGNSLGLQPLSTAAAISAVLEQWARYGVEGFFSGQSPWLDYHDRLTTPLASIVGAKPDEVVVMNQLTVNLHLLMATFYKPTKQKYKIICEAHAFPSDQYMMETQVRFHGMDPAAAIIEVGPREGEMHIRTEDILETIAAHGGELALVLWGGVQYYTGQLFDMQAITMAAHKTGAIAGFDLAHAVGNVELKLHEWGADFAAWCHYKYLNGGPGAVGGAFIHEKYHDNRDLMRFGGWWGYGKSGRFKMKKGFDPAPTAEGWQLSTPSMILYAALYASLEIFDEAGMAAITKKGAQLSDYLMYLMNGEDLRIVTPHDKGCQVSLDIGQHGRKIFDQLVGHGIFADWREPAVIRVAPVPLYNTFTEVYEFAQVLKKLLRSA